VACRRQDITPLRGGQFEIPALCGVPNARHRPHQELLKKLGASVRRERQRMGYTQETLAELIDVHPRMVQKIEAGETNILATTAMRLQAALECEWTALMPPVKIEKRVPKAR